MITLDKWQEDVLKAKGDVLLCTGRRVGKTYIMARKAVDRMAESKTPIIVVSLTEDQARIIVLMALNYAKEKYRSMIKSGKDRPTLRNFSFKNGSKLISRPVGNTGDSTRGFEGGVLLVDEASRMPKLFWLAAKPVLLTTNGELWMCSTPFGKQGYFWEKFNESYNLKEPKARFTAFYISSVEVMTNRPIGSNWTLEQREGAARILEEERRDMSTLEFGQEYLGLFLEDLRQFFTDDLITSCMTLKRGDSLPPLGNRYLGVDCAGVGGDEEVLLSLVRSFDREKLTMIDMQITTNVRMPEAVRRILSLDLKHQYRTIYIDDGGLGVGVFDPLLEHEQTRRKVVPINNASRSLDRDQTRRKKLLKEDLYTNLKHLMELGKIRLFDDPELFQSLKSVQCEHTEGRTRIFGNYTHCCEALIRAAWCMKDMRNDLWCR